jgi:DNA-binding transcriptional LysR family regulator
MDHAGEMAAFVRAVDLGGFSAAARALGVTPSALSKLVTRLEGRLGVRLLNRTTRKLALTPEGHAFFQRSQRILADIEAAETEVARFRKRPGGLLRVNVGVAFGMHQLAFALPDFLARYPDMKIDLTVTDRIIDLIEEGADLAIRTGTLADSSLVARKICDLQRVICASPRYLKRHGAPRRPEDLLKHNCITISGHPELKHWPFESTGSPRAVRTIEVAGNAVVNNAESVLQLGLLGVGIIRLADVIVGDAIRKGKLVALLTASHHVEPLPLQAVYPYGHHRSPKVAAFVDFLLERFADAPWRLTAPGKRHA